MLDASIVSFLLEKIQDLPGTLVYVLVAALVFGEAALFLGFVLPGETAVIVAGVVASKGHVNVVSLCAIVVASAIIGDSVGYEVGRKFGPRLMTLPLVRTRKEGIERALAGLRRRGPIYVFLGRFTAFLRAVIPGLAGMSRLPYRKFLAANALGGLLWGIAYTLLGYFAGAALNSIERVSGWVGIGVLVLVVIIIGVIVLAWRKAEAQIQAALNDGEDPDDSTKGVE